MTWIERSLQTTTCRLFIKFFMYFACMHKKAKELWNESGKVKLPHISLNKHLSPQIWTRATHKQYTKKANVVYSNLPERKQFDASDKTPDILKWWFKLRFSNYFRWKSTFCQKKHLWNMYYKERPLRLASTKFKVGFLAESGFE